MRDTPHVALNIDSFLGQLALRYDETRRNTFIHNLLAIIEAETLPYIVAGDFNTSDNALIYPEIAALMRDSFREAGVGMGATWPVALSGLQTLLRIDYVWHSADLHTLTAATGPPLGSDHLPLLVTLVKS